MGPKPLEGDSRKLGKRKKISSEAQRNYLIISDDYPLLKQRVTLKFKNLDYKETMKLMGKIGEINILVGDEVAGAISAELIDVPWDKALSQGTSINSAEIAPATSSPTKILISPILPINFMVSL